MHGWIKSVGLAVGLFVAIGAFIPSTLADQPLVQRLLTQTQGEDTRWAAPRVWVAHTMDLTIHLERFFFPWFERTRMALGGWHFGVADAGVRTRPHQMSIK